MDLWVRSQTKTLLEKIDGIALNDKGLEIYSTKTGRIFGTYKTKERALEVLDEIDEFVDLLNNNLLGLSDDGVHRRHSVYQMPQE